MNTSSRGKDESEAHVPAVSPKGEVRFDRDHIVRKFITTWLFFMVLLSALALIINVDWAKPYCQEALNQAFHRRVKLGHLSWSFGLNGLAIDTTRMSVVNNDSSPFLKAGASEIGISFVNLLHKRWMISHLSFRDPELWAKRIGKNTWNFEDIFELGPDVRYLQFKKGKVHIADAVPKQEPAWNAIDLSDVKLQFVWPHKHKKTPFQLSFKLHKPGYTTGFQMSGLGSGELENWQDNHYKFDIKAEKVNVDDFRSFAMAIAEKINWGENADKKIDSQSLKGLFNFTVKAEGVVSKGLNADITAEGEHLSFGSPVLGMVQANEAKTEAKVTLDKKKIEWTDMVARIANVEIRSKGELLDWQESDTQYTADVDSRVDDLSKIGKIISLPKSDKRQAINIDPSKLSGKAEIEMKLLGDANKSKMTTDLKTPGLLIEDIIAKLPEELSPAVCLMGLNKRSQVRGEIKFVPNEMLEVTDGKIEVPGGTLNTTGKADLKRETTRFNFNAKQINLKDAQKHLASSDEEFKAVSKMICLPTKKSLVLNGTMNLNGVLETFASGHKTTGEALLRNAQFALSDGSLNASKLNGRIQWNNYRLAIDSLKGSIGKGQFDLSGNIQLKGEGALDLKIRSSHLELAQLQALLKVLKVELPLFTERRLYGKVKDIAIEMTGSRTKPVISFTAVPEDLYYLVAGMGRPLRATSGIIAYDKDVLSLDRVGFITHSDEVKTTLAIDHLSGDARLREIKVETAGIDLQDVHYYLSSALLPPALKHLYTDFLRQYKIASVHGRVNGDGLCRLQGDKILLDGQLGLKGAGAQIGDNKFPIENIAGTLSASGTQLLVKDLGGSWHDSSFTLNGQVDDYRTDKPRWSTKMTASIQPAEMLALLPSLSDQIAQWNLKLSAAGPLALTASIDGDQKNNQVSFALSSEASNNLVISGTFGTLYQPKGEPLVFDGDMTVNADQIKVVSTRLLLGDSPLVANGTIDWLRKPGEQGSKNADVSDSKISVCVRSPDPMPAGKLIAVVDPTIGKDQIEGSVDGFIGVTGTIGSPRATGKITFNKISVPKYDLHDLTGKIEMLQDNKEHAVQKARLDFPSIKMGYLTARGVSADLSFEPATESRQQPRITIEDGHADIAGGSVAVSGLFLLDKHELDLTAELDKVQAADLATELVGHPGELSGTVEAEFHLKTKGNDYKEALTNICGDGKFSVADGTVARFGHLQTKLTQVNLLHQGIFGFNLNNLLQSVVPVRTGRFIELSSDLRVDKGILYLDDMRYNGEDMRLWGAGKANLPENAVNIEIAGKIPRVSPSFLGGTFGEFSRAFTIQKVMHVMTRGQLEALPSLPFLGDIAADKPRIFTFKVNSTLDKPKALASSIEKSFHWLPSRPTASAHPVPGISLSN